MKTEHTKSMMHATASDFNVERIDPVVIKAKGSLKDRDFMSPFCWDMPDGTVHMLLRGVPNKNDKRSQGKGRI